MKTLILSMVSYYLLLWFSDVVIGQMITGIVTIAIGYMTYRTNIKLREVKVIVDQGKADVKEVKATVAEVKGTVDIVHTTINSMRDKELEQTKELGEKTGELKGAEDARTRAREDKIDKANI